MRMTRSQRRARSTDTFIIPSDRPQIIPDGLDQLRFFVPEMGAHNFFQFSKRCRGPRKICIAGISGQILRSTPQADDEFMNHLVLRLQLGHNLPKLSAARRFDTGEHVRAFDVMVHLENPAFMSAKRTESAKVLSHIERQHNALQMLRWRISRFYPGKYRTNLAHLHEVVAMYNGELLPLTAVGIGCFRHRRRFGAGRLVKTKLIQGLGRKICHDAQEKTCGCEVKTAGFRI